MFFFSTLDLILLLPAMALALYAQFKVKSTYNKFAQVASNSGFTGKSVAQRLLQENGVHDVTVEETPGTLTDHYDPTSRTLRLSSDIYRSNSVAALGIAAHETGHAMQHALGYGPLQVRNAIIPVTRFGSSMAIPLFLIGMVVSIPFLMDLGILLFAGAVLFQLITLPVEFDASKRALLMLQNGSYLRGEEVGSARKVLNAAALTYVAALTVAVAHLVRLLLIRNSE